MIVLLYGPDDYGRDQKRRFYEAEFQKKYGVRSEQLDLQEEGGLSKLDIVSREQSLFEDKRLFVVRNAYEAEAKKLAKLLAPFFESKGLHLLFSENKKPVKALAALLASPVKTEVFEVPEGAAWKKFVLTGAKKLGVMADSDALSTLEAAYAGDTWALATELQKLAHAGKVTKEDVLALGVEVAGDTFPLIQSLRGPRPASRLSALAALQSANEPAAKVFNILAALRPQEAPLFAKYDEAIKFGRMDFEEALTDLVIS